MERIKIEESPYCASRDVSRERYKKIWKEVILFLSAVWISCVGDVVTWCHAQATYCLLGLAEPRQTISCCPAACDKCSPQPLPPPLDSSKAAPSLPPPLPSNLAKVRSCSRSRRECDKCEPAHYYCPLMSPNFTVAGISRLLMLLSLLLMSCSNYEDDF